jgi:hypothetical protein
MGAIDELLPTAMIDCLQVGYIPYYFIIGLIFIFYPSKKNFELHGVSK